MEGTVGAGGAGSIGSTARARRPLEEEGCPICFEPFELELCFAPRAAHPHAGQGDSAQGSATQGGAAQPPGPHEHAHPGRRLRPRGDERVGEAGEAGAGAGGDAQPGSQAEAAGGEVVHFCGGCGCNVHTDCISRWGRVARERAAEADASSRADCTCPVCRAPWGLRSAGGTAVTGAEAPGVEAVRTVDGRLELSALQPGTRAERDESTFSEWFHRRNRKGAGERAA
ncbi:hypothetical protein T492DRAFT_842230 [Pavlovales sp. CCMP2436]|nr:hypothetical protein T492DRAFT_842230 [Pavlovales sp. CCMP2436]